MSRNYYTDKLAMKHACEKCEADNEECFQPTLKEAYELFKVRCASFVAGYEASERQRSQTAIEPGNN